MNILGSIYAIDEKHIDIIRQQLATTPPPMAGIEMGGKLLCMNMDETDDTLQREFPNHTLSATLLMPPPLAMYKEIDGDQEGFIQAYDDYLDHDNSVQDYIASMLFFLHMGGNILLYTPALLEDDCIWMNTLMMFFFTRYGITIGTSEKDGFLYDTRYDGVIADTLFSNNYIDVFHYINICPYDMPPLNTQEKVIEELSPFCYTNDIKEAYDIFCTIKNSILQNGVPITKPAITFN